MCRISKAAARFKVCRGPLGFAKHLSNALSRCQEVMGLIMFFSCKPSWQAVPVETLDAGQDRIMQTSASRASAVRSAEALPKPSQLAT